MRDVLCVVRSSQGGVTVDEKTSTITLPLDEKLSAKAIRVGLGGGGANAAVAAARLGLRVALVSGIGRDDVGTQVEQALKQEGVDTAFLSRVSLEQTGISLSLLDESSGQQSSLYAGGANRFLDFTEDVQKTFHTTDWVYVTSFGESREENLGILAEALGQENTHVALAPGAGDLRNGRSFFSRILPRTDILILNEKELPAFLGEEVASAEDAATRLIADGVRIVAITRGKEGAAVYTAQDSFSVPAVVSSVLDTTGAGDAFGATLVASLSKEDDLERAIARAAINAGSVVSTHTAQTGLLTESVLEDKMRRSPVKVRKQQRGSGDAA